MGTGEWKEEREDAVDIGEDAEGCRRRPLSQGACGREVAAVEWERADALGAAREVFTGGKPASVLALMGQQKSVGQQGERDGGGDEPVRAAQ